MTINQVPFLATNRFGDEMQMPQVLPASPAQPVPTPTGNITNINTVFTATDGGIYFVDSSGNATELSASSVVKIGNVTDEFTPTAGQTSFTLTQAPANANVFMFVNGVRVPVAAATVSAKTVTYVPSADNGRTMLTTDRVTFDYVA